MALIPGSVRIGGFIAPSDSVDEYAVTDEKYNRGGYRSVSNLAERDTITAGRRSIGMVVYVISEKETYQLESGTLNENWVVYKTKSSSSVAHSDTTGIQGGKSGEHFHLEELQHSQLTSGGNATIHKHDFDRDRANHTGTQDVSTISGFDNYVKSIVEIANAISKAHDPVTVKDSDSMAFSITGQELTASVKSGAIKHSEIAEIGSRTHSEIDAFMLSKGLVNGLAELDSNGKIPAGNLPGFVDDVVEYASLALFPITGASGIIYIDAGTNITYRWSGTIYSPIGSSLALGETSSTAYRGDRGLLAYNHSQLAHNKTLVGLGNVQNIDTTTTANINPSTDKNFVTDEELGNVQSIPDIIYAIDEEYGLRQSILYKNNTTQFTPTGQYNPATKKYVDDRSLSFFTASSVLYPETAGKLYSVLTPHNSDGDRNVVIKLEHPNALMLRVPNGTFDGGAPGAGSVDLQILRNGVKHCASGGMSALLGGQNNEASGGSSVVVAGSSNVASGSYSGVYNSSKSNALGYYSTCIGGHEITANDHLEVVIGCWNEISTGVKEFDPYTVDLGNCIFNIGNGTSASARKSAFRVLRNGCVGVGVNPTAKLHVGAGSATVPQVKVDETPLLTTPVNGVIEHNSGKLYFTSGGARSQIGPSVSGGGSSVSLYMGVVERFVDITADGYTNWNEFVSDIYATAPVVGTMVLVMHDGGTPDKSNKIQKWNGTAWETIDPLQGMKLICRKDENLDDTYSFGYTYDNGAWIKSMNSLVNIGGSGIKIARSGGNETFAIKSVTESAIWADSNGLLFIKTDDVTIVDGNNGGLRLKPGTEAGQVFQWNGTAWALAKISGSEKVQKYNIIPTGTKDSVNKDFSLSDHEPIDGTVCVWRRGLRMTLSADYTYTHATKTITFTTAPNAGDNIICDFTSL